MGALINVVLPVFGIILTGYLAGRFKALGSDSAAAINRFVFYFALPAALFRSPPAHLSTGFSTGLLSGLTLAAYC